IRSLYNDRSRAECAILTQLRSDHVPLNGYLHRITRVDSPLCSHCNVPETVEHLLLQCRQHVEARERLRRVHSTGSLNLRRLLAPGKKTGALLDFLRATRRF
ncbi:hypothetical protein SCHPADRAFT_805241, partial [Schizopora paradoxa]